MSTKPDSSQIKHETGTLKDIADASKPLADYTALRAYTGTATTVRITTPGIAGFFTRRGTTGLTDNGGTVIIDAGGRAWERVFGGAVRLAWFEVVAGGSVVQNTKIQAAIAATSSFGVLDLDVAGTVLIDTLTTVKIESDLGNNWLYGGLLINKPIKITRSAETVLKVKDFSTAWASQEVGDSICAVLVTASYVHIDGINVDANADNHYEISGAHKWWETGPTAKRPPCGITVSVARNQANVERVLIENCEIYRPLAGISFIGNAVDTQRVAFMNSTLTTGVVKNCVSRNNKVRFARGNCVLFNMGVDSCESIDDVFENSMYHLVRAYSRAINCRAFNSSSIVNCDEILARYNATDLGYWRTTDTAHANFKIIRDGFRVGSLDVYNATYGYSIANCGFTKCRVLVHPPTSFTYADYYVLGYIHLAGYSLGSTPSCYIEDCHSENANTGISLYSDVNYEPLLTTGIRVTGNTILESTYQDMYVFNVQNRVVTGNTFSTDPSREYISVRLNNFVNGIFSNNTFIGTPHVNTYAVAVDGENTGLQLTNNTFSPTFAKLRQYVQTSGTLKVPYPGSLFSFVSANVISGGAYSNGWAEVSSQLEGQENLLRVNTDGTITVQLRLNGAAATNRQIATLLSHLRPRDTVGFVATDLTSGGAYWGRALANGDIQITLPAFPSPSLTQIYAEVTFSRANV